MCSSCRKGGFKKAVQHVQQMQNSAQPAPAMQTMDVYINDMAQNKYKVLYYIGNDGIVTGTMHKSYGPRRYGEKMYVHVNDITDQFSETLPEANTNEEVATEGTVQELAVPSKKLRKKK